MSAGQGEGTKGGLEAKHRYFTSSIFWILAVIHVTIWHTSILCLPGGNTVCMCILLKLSAHWCLGISVKIVFPIYLRN